MPPEIPPATSISVHPDGPDEPAAALIRQALDETRELVRLEVALARDEVRGELSRATACGVAFGAAAACVLLALSMFLGSIALAFAVPWIAALAVGGVLLCLAGLLAFRGWRGLPRKPLGRTRDRLETDVKGLKERIA